MILAWLMQLALAAEPVGWRRDGSGTFPGADPPATWSTASHVAWRTPLPAWGNASPVVSGDRVYVTAEPTTLLAVDTATGRVLWQQAHDVDITLHTEEQVARARAAAVEIERLRTAVLDQQRQLSLLRKEARTGTSDAALLARVDAVTRDLQGDRERLAALEAQFPVGPAMTSANYASGFVGMASSTPVTDGERVFAVFANGVVAARDREGGLLWSVRLGAPALDMRGYYEGHAASPVLAGDVLVVGLGDLVGLDAATGQVRWRRPGYRDFGTPLVHPAAGGTIVTPSGDLVRARDGALLGSLGHELWYIGPIEVDGDVVIAGNTQSGRIFAARFALDAPSPNRLVARQVWATDLPSERYYGAPARLGDVLHTATRHGTVLGLDARTGRITRRAQLEVRAPAEVYPSVVVGGDRLYVTTDQGVTHVLRVTDDGYAPMGVSTLGEQRASFFLVGRDLYARTLDALWKIRDRP